MIKGRNTRRRYKKKPRTAGSAQAPVTGSFEMSKEEVQNPKEIPTPADIPTTHLDDVKKAHPGMSDAQARLIVNAENARDRAKERLADKQEKLSGKQQDLWRTYLSQYTDVETEEEKAARQRREKKAQRWAAVGDAISALANMGGAMGGATPTQPSKTMSQAQAERMEHARKLRELERKNLRDKNKREYEITLKDYETGKKEYDNAVKSLSDAEKNITDREVQAMTLQYTDRTQNRADDALKITKKKADDARTHQIVMEGIAQQNANTNTAKVGEQHRHNVAMENKPSGHGGGGGSKKDDWEGRYLRYSYENENRYNKWENEVDKNGISNRYKYPNEKSRRMQFAASEMNQPKVTPKKPTGGGSKPNSAAGGNKPRTAGGNGQKPASGGNGGNKGGWAAGLSRGKEK